VDKSSAPLERPFCTKENLNTEITQTYSHLPEKCPNVIAIDENTVFGIEVIATGH